VDWIGLILGGKIIWSNYFSFVICSFNWFGFKNKYNQIWSKNFRFDWIGFWFSLLYIFHFFLKNILFY